MWFLSCGHHPVHNHREEAENFLPVPLDQKNLPD
jgi:hypothetical protein